MEELEEMNVAPVVLLPFFPCYNVSLTACSNIVMLPGVPSIHLTNQDRRLGLDDCDGEVDNTFLHIFKR